MAANKPDNASRRRGDPDQVDPSPDVAPDPGATRPPADQVGPVPTEVLRRSEHLAGHLRETAAALFLNASLGQVLKDVDTVAYKLYRDRLLADCGGPTDPIEIILIEQIAMAHLITGYLHAKGLNSSVECATAYLGAAARLTGELRRTSLALQGFRAAARQLNKAAADERAAPAGMVLEVEAGAAGNCVSTEKEVSPMGADDDEPRIFPLRRSATI
jgi:hypothetical protein